VDICGLVFACRAISECNTVLRISMMSESGQRPASSHLNLVHDDHSENAVSIVTVQSFQASMSDPVNAWIARGAIDTRHLSADIKLIV
jgi:hypothetical protein